jgi:hypothetical protein
MSQDPAVVAFDGKDKQLLLDPQQLNSYSYARNNPLVLVDRTGEKVYIAAYSAPYGVPSIPFLAPLQPVHLYYYVVPDQPYRITETIAPAEDQRQAALRLGADAFCQ